LPKKKEAPAPAKINKAKAIEEFLDFEDAETNDELFMARIGIDGAMARLKEIKAKLDEELMRRMTEQGIAKFQFGDANADDGKIVEMKHEAIPAMDTKKLTNMLLGDDPDRRDMARRCLSSGQGAWKKAEVRDVADTIGDRDLIKYTRTGRIVVKAIPNKQKKMIDAQRKLKKENEKAQAEGRSV